MNCTKVFKASHSEQFPNQFCNRAPFKIEKMPKHQIKREYPPKPFPLKKEHVANPTKKRLKEEEKGRWNFQNKENTSYNATSFGELIKLPVDSQTPKKQKFFSESLKQLEKEVKLANLEFNHQERPGDSYNDERVALEDEYGLPEDNMFKIDVTDEYEEQEDLAQEYENLNSSHPLNKSAVTPPTEEVQDSCDGLKKGIDNDAIIAELSTVDGISAIEEFMESSTKKKSEDEELENIDIFFHDLKAKPEGVENFTHYDCNFSKVNEDDSEEEKINTCKNQLTSEKFPMLVDFKEDDYEMDIEKILYNHAMYEETVPLMKKSSLRMERGLSLFEDHADGFLDDFPMKLEKTNSRERSYSKFTEDEWYKRDLPKNLDNENSQQCKEEDKFEDIQMEEPELMDNFDTIVSPEPENEEIFDFAPCQNSLNDIEYKVMEKDMTQFEELFKQPIEEKDECEENEVQYNETIGENDSNHQKIPDEGLLDFNNYEEPSHF